MYMIFGFCYKMWAIPTGTNSAFKKKSPSIWLGSDQPSGWDRESGCDKPHLGPPREAEVEAESSQARGHEPHLTPREERNEAILGGNIGNDELTPP